MQYLCRVRPHRHLQQRGDPAPVLLRLQVLDQRGLRHSPRRIRGEGTVVRLAPGIRAVVSHALHRLNEPLRGVS